MPLPPSPSPRTPWLRGPEGRWEVAPPHTTRPTPPQWARRTGAVGSGSTQRGQLHHPFLAEAPRWQSRWFSCDTRMPAGRSVGGGGYTNHEALPATASGRDGHLYCRYCSLSVLRPLCTQPVVSKPVPEALGAGSGYMSAVLGGKMCSPLGGPQRGAIALHPPIRTHRRRSPQGGGEVAPIPPPRPPSPRRARGRGVAEAREGALRVRRHVFHGNDGPPSSRCMPAGGRVGL